jgi:hypothetical protein
MFVGVKALLLTPTNMTAISMTISMTMSMTMTTIQKDREAAYEECRALHPTRYTSDPDVINNPEAMAAVKAEWDIYFRAMDAVLVRFPYTDEEKLHHPAKTCQPTD